MIKIIALLVLFLNISCGLQPVYRTLGSESKSDDYKQELATIKVEVKQSSIKRKLLEQQLTNHLEDMLNPDFITADYKYLLTISLQSNQSSSFITSVGTTGRSKIILTASYQLKQINTNELIASNSTSAEDDTNITDKRFANYATEQEIERNLTKIVAANIRNLVINDIFVAKQQVKN